MTVHLIEVGPRDGLQLESKQLSVDERYQLVIKLSQAGLQEIEVGAMVSPRAVPQMANSQALASRLAQNLSANWTVLVPNERGLQAAIDAGVRRVAVFTSASETFNQHNIRCSIQQSIDRFKPVISLAKRHKISVRGYVSCAVHCPFESWIAPEAVYKVSHQLTELGCDQISLGETTGRGSVVHIKQLLRHLLHSHGSLNASHFACHFHDTYGQALANVFAALDAGIQTFDTSIAGLGGCPYSPGASGNLATEDLVYALQAQGELGHIDLGALTTISQWICMLLGRVIDAKSTQAIVASAALAKPDSPPGCAD